MSADGARGGTVGGSNALACIACSYSLAGLPDDGVCPECGFPVESSILGGRLRGMDPAYRSKLAKGVFLVRAALVLLLSSFVLAVGVYVLESMSVLASRRLLGVPCAGAIVAVGLFFAGVLFASARDPRDVAVERALSSRAVARVGLPVSGVLIVLAAFAPLMKAPIGLWTTMVTASALLAVVATVCSLLAAARRLAAVLTRLGQPHFSLLARSIGSLTILIGLCAGALVLAGMGLGVRMRTWGCVAAPAALVVGVGPILLAAAFDNLLHPIGRAIAETRKRDSKAQEAVRR